MNYYNAKVNAEAQRDDLRRQAAQDQLAQLAQEVRPPLLAIDIKINVGRLAHWRLQWNTLKGQPKVNPQHDTVLNCG
jgi:hypothetical protein